MIRFSKIFLCITTAILLLWQLPWCYSFFTAKASNAPFTLYSSVAERFISIGFSEEKGMARQSDDGTRYTEEQTDSLLPFFYMRQLMADEKFPDTICGIAVTPKEAQMSTFSFRCSPMDINVKKVPLYPLLESKSRRVDLVMPPDVFRITDKRIEFVNSQTNSIDEDKSQMFTKALLKKGFTFPSRRVAGNPTTRKDYDEGYIILDSKGRLFHMKQMVGRPYVRHIEQADSISVEHIFITEFKSRKTLAFLTDRNNCFYVVNSETYDVVPAGIESYDPQHDGISIFGNMLDWTVSIKRGGNTVHYALNASDYSLIDKYVIDNGNSRNFGLRFTSVTDKYVKPRFY